MRVKEMKGKVKKTPNCVCFGLYRPLYIQKFYKGKKGKRHKKGKYTPLITGHKSLIYKPVKNPKNYIHQDIWLL